MQEKTVPLDKQFFDRQFFNHKNQKTMKTFFSPTFSLTFVLWMNHPLHAQLVFQKSIGSLNTEQQIAACYIPSGGLIICGESKPSTGTSDAFAVYLNNNFDTLWTHAYGGNQDDYFRTVKNTFDNGFVFGGGTYSFTSSLDAWVVKTNANGIVQWAKTISGSSLDEATDIIQTSDSGFVATGTTASFGGGSNDIYLFKLDKAGNLQWTKTYGGSGYDAGYKVVQSFDKGYTIIGKAGSYCSGYSNMPYLLHTDSLGNVLWSKCFSMSTNGCCPKLDTLGKDYIVAGSFNTGFPNNNQALLMRLDSVGNVIWAKQYDVSTNFGEYANWFDKTNDGGYVLAGTTSSCGSGNSDAFLMKVNSSGDTVWTRVSGSSGNNTFSYVKQLNDGSYLAVGYSTANGNGDIYLMKTDSSAYALPCSIESCGFQKYNNFVSKSSPSISGSAGGTQTNVNLTANNFSPTVLYLCGTVSANSMIAETFSFIYPNPFSTQTVLQINNSVHNATLTVNNCFGQTVAQIKNLRGQTITFNRDNLPSGLYFVRLTEENKTIAVDKLVIADR